MGGPEAAGMVTVLAHTAQLDAATLAAARRLMDLAFDGGFTDEDWDHGLGGMHAVVHEGDRLVAHGSLVARRFIHDGRPLRCGYVEGVAVHPDHQRTGLGHLVMQELEALAPAYDLLALSATPAGAALYARRGWKQWSGRTSVLAPGGVVPTPDDDGGVWVLGLDLLDGELTCDWRDGDVW